MTPYTLSDQDRLWLDGVWEKLQRKMAAQADRVGDKIPYTTENGLYRKDWGEGKDVYWWTNGFWPGMLWQMYHATKDEKYRKYAESVEQRLDKALHGFEGLHHDVGFMWLHSAVANYRLTGNEQSKTRGLQAASILAGRYNSRGRFIRAWNNDCIGWMIVDCMMNIPLLYWASRETNDPRFTWIARDHADTTIRVTVRPDGSCNHIVILDPTTGEFVEAPGGQGYESGSSWSRGQSWALYGFGLSYRYTQEEQYLATAKQVAHYFIANAAMSDYVPLLDFRAPAEPVYYDTTAGMIAACGLLELVEHVPEYERPMYQSAALKMLRATVEKHCDWNPDTDAIVHWGSERYHSGVNMPIIYGDYFLIEAILRLRGQSFHIW